MASVAYLIAPGVSGELAMAQVSIARSPAADNAAATFRAERQEVLVEASVIGKRGDFQRDLRLQDFKIQEDGKEQKITSFSLESSGTSGNVRKRFIALVFETEYDGLRGQATQFVDSVASPDVYIALFCKVKQEMRLQQAFTADAMRIKESIRTMPAVATMVDDLRGGPAPFLDTYAARISSVAAALAPVRGRKALILFTDGLVAQRSAATQVREGTYIRSQQRPDGDSWLRAIDACNAADVSVYPFIQNKVSEYAGGGKAEDYYDRPLDPARDNGARTDRIRDLAERTNGKYVPGAANDLARYLRSVIQEQSDYYLLAYVPTAGPTQKTCHKIKVQVSRRGLEVKARDSYCASESMGESGLSASVSALETRLASSIAGKLVPAIQLSWFYSKPNLPVVDIAMDIGPGALKLRGRYVELIWLGIAYREDGTVAARVGDAVNLDFDTPAKAADALQKPYHYSKQFNLAPGRYLFRMAVQSGDVFGRAEKPLEIEPWDGKRLSISGIALSVKDYPILDATAELQSSFLAGPRRLRSRKQEVEPMGGSEFRLGQPGTFYFEIYDPRLEQAIARSMPLAPLMRMWVEDSITAEHKIDSGVMDAGMEMSAGFVTVPIELTLPVSALPVGSYRLVLRVTDANGQDSVERHADFRVK